MVPIAFNPSGYFAFLPIKWTLAMVLVAAGVAALILECRTTPPSSVLAAWGGLLAALIAASVVGVGDVTSWIGYPGRYLGVIAWIAFFGAFLIGACLRDEPGRALVIRAASGASIVVSAYALGQAIGVDPVEWSEEIDESRTRSTIGNAAFLGAYLAMIVPLVGRMALSTAEPPPVRTLHTVAALLAAAALVTTQTRGAWIGALAGIALVCGLEFRRLRTLRAGVAAPLVAALLALFVVAAIAPSASRLGSIRDPSAGTAEGRLIQWERTLDLIADRPVLGWGPETYAFTFPRYIDAEFERTVGRDVVPDRAHNVVLDVAASAGVLGLAAYLALIAMIAIIAWRVGRTRARDPATIALAGACAAYVLQLLFSFPLAELDAVFWVFAGLLVAPASSRALAIPRGWAAAPALLAVFLAAWGARELAADRLLRRALDAEARGAFSEAQDLVDRAADAVPIRAQYRQAAARLNRRIGEISHDPGDFADGLNAIDEARELLPEDLELAMDEGDLLLSWGETTGNSSLIDRAAGEYEHILELDPASSRVHLKLGVAYVQLGRGDEAEREWLAAASLSPDSPGPFLNLGTLYERRGDDARARAAVEHVLELDPANEAAKDILRELGA